MKLPKLLRLAAITLALWTALDAALFYYSTRIHPPKDTNGMAVVEAIHQFAIACEQRRQPLPQWVTLGQLVDQGFLRAEDLGTPVAREYACNLHVHTMGDPSAILVLHFPHE